MTSVTRDVPCGTIPPMWSGPEAARIAGITYRQLNYWARTGLVRPSIHDAQGSGDHRRYDNDDVRCLAAVNALDRILGGATFPRGAATELVARIRANQLGLFTLGPGVVLHPAMLIREGMTGTLEQPAAA
jgi:hypothetical protein